MSFIDFVYCKLHSLLLKYKLSMFSFLLHFMNCLNPYATAKELERQTSLYTSLLFISLCMLILKIVALVLPLGHCVL